MYRPSYNPIDIPLTSSKPQAVVESGINEEEEIAISLLQDRTRKREAGEIFVPGNMAITGAPITLEQATVIESQKLLLLQDIATTRNRIKQVQELIDEQTYLSNGQSISFNIDLKRRGRLRRALKKAMNYSGDTLTYEMYRSALKARAELEKSEAHKYTTGQWSEDGVSDTSS